MTELHGGIVMKFLGEKTALHGLTELQGDTDRVLGGHIRLFADMAGLWLPLRGSIVH